MIKKALVSIIIVGSAVGGAAAPAFAKQGADDPAGHVRKGRGADDAPGDDKGGKKGGKGRGADDAPGHVRQGRGADDGAKRS